MNKVRAFLSSPALIVCGGGGGDCGAVCWCEGMFCGQVLGFWVFLYVNGLNENI